MAKEHAPIQIGLPDEPKWRVAEPMATALVAFLGRETPPDPGEVFLAAARAFGGEPGEVEPLPIEDERVPWGFAFGAPGREARVLIWCERADPAHAPDPTARDARWVLSLETLLDGRGPVEDFACLLDLMRGAAGDSLRLILDPTLGAAWRADELAGLLAERGANLDERQLYRIEVFSRAPQGAYWLSTVGLARVAKPELEILEVPAANLREALELLDAVAARLVTEDAPHAGVAFEAGPQLEIALVPAREVAETVAPEHPGGLSDRRGDPAQPRAALCAPRPRGAFRAVWGPPLEALAALADGSRALVLAARVARVRERQARATYADFASVLPEAVRAGARAFVRVASRASSSAADAPPHVWLEVREADGAGGRGTVVRTSEPGGVDPAPAAGEGWLDYRRDEVVDWRIEGLRPRLPVAGPGDAHLLRAGS